MIQTLQLVTKARQTPTWILAGINFTPGQLMVVSALVIRL
jgi:hypothetical protein